MTPSQDNFGGSLPDPQHHQAKDSFNYERYCALPEDGRRYQVLEGELDVTPAPSTFHQGISRNLEFALLQHVRKNKLGILLDSPVDVILSSDVVVQPDIVFVAQERASIVTKRAIEGPPDLVVEILSPWTRRTDRITKLPLYARFGVHECWLVDPEEKSMEIFSLSGNQYLLAATAYGNETIGSSLFPGFVLSLEEVFTPDI